jgi:protein gp37
MATNSKIEWCSHTINLWFGCTKVHAGCDNCYALAFSKRLGHDVWGNDKPRKMIIDVWGKIKKYQKDAEKLGEIHRVFVGSMQDIFEKPMPLIDQNGNPLLEGQSEFWNTGQLRDKFFNEVVPNSPNLMFLLLTKRPSNINKFIPESWKTNPPKNVMFGTSPVNQETSEKLIVQLSKVNGNRFLSIEPQLDIIDLMANANDGTDRVLLDLVSWIINGGESGHHKRAFDCDWARIIRDDCKAKGVPFFFKQIDKIQAIPDDLKILEFPKNYSRTNNLKQLKMKTIGANAKSKEERFLINNQKCKLALDKGYKYDKATGEIIGQRKKAIRAHINGYTIITFVADGVRKYLYGTTFIEYIIKSENESISLEDIELAKAYVKPTKEYLDKIKALKEAKPTELKVIANLSEVLSNELKSIPLAIDYSTNDKPLKKVFINSGYQFRPNTYSKNYLNNNL